LTVYSATKSEHSSRALLSYGICNTSAGGQGKHHNDAVTDKDRTYTNSLLILSVCFYAILIISFNISITDIY